MATRDIVVIGGSTGSGAVLKALVAALPGDLAASVFVTTHMAAHGSSFLADLLAAATSLPVAPAVDGQPIEPRRIYLAVPDRHLLLLNGVVSLGLGPRENMARPAVDPMFRSAALSYGSRVIGVVLTGLLDDGASGIAAIKARGGAAVVQHPLDAEADGMPLAALQAAEIDYVAPTRELAATLVGLVGTEAGASPPITDALRLEVEIAAGARLGSDHLRGLATPSALSCPACQGVLSEMHDTRPLRYRCQIGHGFTAEALAARIGEVDEAVRVAMRIMEERVTLADRMARDAEATGRVAVAELYAARAAEYRRYAAILREAATSTLRIGGSRQQGG